MRQRSFLVFLCVVSFVAPILLGATITRQYKTPHGGTAWKDGIVLSASELNSDFDTIYNDYNGNITNANVAAAAAIEYSKLNLTSLVVSGDITDATIVNVDINGSAGIDPEKIDDESVSDAEQQGTTTPGITGSQTNATTLQAEIQMLRYAIQRLAHGNDSTLFWFDPPTVHCGNLLYNGSFELHNAGATTEPDGWTAVNTPDIAYSQTDLTEGWGEELHITANGGTEEGISMTLAGLKPTTTYSLRGRAYEVSGTSCTIRTTGAGTEASVTTLSSGAYETLSDSFITDATPTDVVVILEADEIGDVCKFDHISAVEESVDAVAAPSSLIAQDTVTGETALTISYVTFSSAAVTVPDDGYYIKVIGTACARITAGTGEMNSQLTENTVQVDVGGCETDSGSCNTPLYHVNTNPTPGTTYTYDVDMKEFDGSPSYTAGATAACNTLASNLVVELIRAY